MSLIGKKQTYLFQNITTNYITEVVVANVQSELRNYHDQIKLGTYEENESLRNKRDLLINELRESLKDEKVPNSDSKLTFTSIDQGSYAMKTGVKPIDGDYDIDVGIVFDIENNDYDSKKLKKLVRDTLSKQYNRTVEYNRPCISVSYSAGYHVDLPIYARNNDDLHISWGKENSQDHVWYKADPEGLKKWVQEVSTDSNARAQFRRCVRYLKRWKNNNFKSSGNIAPPSIGLTIQARNNFHYYEGDDLECLIRITKGIRDSFHLFFCSEDLNYYQVVVTNLPVEPYKNVYYKMTYKQLDEFYKKIDGLVEALEAVQVEESIVECSKILNKIFGDFPIISEAIKSSKEPYVPTGMSA